MPNAFNFSSTTPAAPAGTQNVTFQADASSIPNVSAHVPVPPVASVNNKTGAVTLAASDLGAVAVSSVGAASGIATLDANQHLTAAQLGIVPVANGGTGATTAGAALTALGAIAASQLGAASGVATLDSNSHLTATQLGVVAIANGGTGATTAAAALTALGAVASSLVGAASGLATLDVNKLLLVSELPVVPVANGGTGQTTAAAALSALGAAKSGANSDITSLAALFWTGDFNANSHNLANLASGSLQNGGPLYCLGVGNTFQASRIYTDTSNNLLIEHQQTTNVWVRSLQLSQGGIVTFSTPANINFGSNWQPWTPTVTCSGSMAASGFAVSSAEFLRVGPLLYFQLRINMNLSGGSNIVYVGMPASLVNDYFPVTCFVYGSAVPGSPVAWGNTVAYLGQNTSILNVYLPGGSQAGGTNFNSGALYIFASGFYRCA